MEWQAVVIVMQILMLAVGWFLFQQARGELSARAAETPVLGEVKALQRSIKQLLGDLEQASARASERSERASEQSGRAAEQLEARCMEAQQLIASLDDQLQRLLVCRDGRQAGAALPATASHAGLHPDVIAPLSAPAAAVVDMAVTETRFSASPLVSSPASKASDARREMVFALADAGGTSGAIARETGLSEGEIETLLGLRLRRA